VPEIVLGFLGLRRRFSLFFSLEENVYLNSIWSACMGVKDTSMILITASWLHVLIGCNDCNYWLLVVGIACRTSVHNCPDWKVLTRYARGGGLNCVTVDGDQKWSIAVGLLWSWYLSEWGSSRMTESIGAMVWKHPRDEEQLLECFQRGGSF